MVGQGGVNSANSLEIPNFAPHDLMNLRSICEYYGTTCIHKMPPEATAILEKYDILTTTEPRWPGDFLEYQDRANTERVLGVLAANTRQLMQNVDGYRDAGDRLGFLLADTLSCVTSIHGEGVHVISPNPQTKDGTVSARRVDFVVDDEPQALHLSRTLQPWLRTAKLDLNNSAVPRRNERGLWVVETDNVDEYMVRVIGSTVTQLIAEADAKEGFTLPPNKYALQHWIKLGETFPADKKARLQAIDSAYQILKMRLTGTYDWPRQLRPAVNQYPLGTEPCATLEGLRKIFNGLIWELRGGSQFNQEQNPDKSARLLIEQGVDIRRDPVPIEELRFGPPTPRRARSSELILEKAVHMLDDSRRHPVQTTLGLLAKAAGAGVETAAAVTLKNTPGLTKAGKLFVKDYEDWKQQRRLAMAAYLRLRAVILGPGAP